MREITSSCFSAIFRPFQSRNKTRQPVFLEELNKAIGDEDLEKIRDLLASAKRDEEPHPNAMELREMLCHAIFTRKKYDILRALTEFPHFDAKLIDTRAPPHQKSLLSIAAETHNLKLCSDLLQKGADIDGAFLSSHAASAIRAIRVIHDIFPLEKTPLAAAMAACNLYDMLHHLKLAAGGIPFNEKHLDAHWALALNADRPDMAAAILALADPAWYQYPSRWASHQRLCCWLRDYENDRRRAADNAHPRSSRFGTAHRLSRRISNGTSNRSPITTDTSEALNNTSALKKAFLKAFPPILQNLAVELRTQIIDDVFSDGESFDESFIKKAEMRRVNREFEKGFFAYLWRAKNHFYDFPHLAFVDLEDLERAGEDFPRLPIHLHLDGEDFDDKVLKTLSHWSIAVLTLTNCRPLDGSGFLHLPSELMRAQIKNAPSLKDSGIKNLLQIHGDPSNNRKICDLNLSRVHGISGIGLEDFTSLRELTLSECNGLTAQGMALLSSSLQVLRLDHSHIDDRHLRSLPRLRKLLFISLRDHYGVRPFSGADVQITDEGVQRFLDDEIFPLLKKIDLSGCIQVSQGMKEALRERGIEVVDD